MKDVKIVCSGIDFPVAESLAKQFVQKCSHENLGFRLGTFESTKDEITFHLYEVVRAKAGAFPCPVENAGFADFADDFNKVGARMLEAMQFGVKKPETGLMPERIWQEQRVKSINEAIERYNNHQQIIPVEWVKERNELLKKLCTI